MDGNGNGNGNGNESGTNPDNVEFDEISYESSEEEFWEEVVASDGDDGSDDENVGISRKRMEAVEDSGSILNTESGSQNKCDDTSSVIEISCSSSNQGSGPSMDGDSNRNNLPLSHSELESCASTDGPSQKSMDWESIDYEKECNKLITLVYPKLQYRESMIQRYDLRDLYDNLKDQYHDMVKKNNPNATRGASEGIDSDSDAYEYEVIEESFENHASMNIDDKTLKVCKWLERFADDPEDYEEACRQLCHSIYGDNDPDQNVDTMLSRSSPKCLYRYLKNYHWYLLHTNQFVEGGLCNRNVGNDDENSNKNSADGENEEEQQHQNNSCADESTNSKRISQDRGMSPSRTKVKSLALLFAAKSNSYQVMQIVGANSDSNPTKTSCSETIPDNEKDSTNIKSSSEKNDNSHNQVLQVIDENEAEKLRGREDLGMDDGEDGFSKSNTRPNKDGEITTILVPGIDSTGENSETFYDSNGVSSHDQNSSPRSPLNSVTKGASEIGTCNILKEDDAKSTIVANGCVENRNDHINEKQLSSQSSPSYGGKTGSMPASKPVQETEVDRKVDSKSQQKSRKNVKDLEEIEWRKHKIEESLKSIIEETEKCELEAEIRKEFVIALQAGALKTALTKKYYDTKRGGDIFYPSVAKALRDFSLIEEAEKSFDGEFPFDVATALCSVAASRLRGDINEVDEEESFVQRATVKVVLDDEESVSLDDALNGNKHQHESELSSTKLEAENKIRNRRMRNDLLALIEHAEKNYVDEMIEDEAIEALLRAANRLVFVKKYFNVDTDEFVYYPSVAKSIIDSSLFQEAGHFYSDGEEGFPMKYESALREAALVFGGNYHVNELDDYVINMTVDVAIDEANVGCLFKRSGDSSLTALSLPSLRGKEIDVNTEASSADEDNSGDSRTGSINQAMKMDSKNEEPADDFEMQCKQQFTPIRKTTEARNTGLGRENFGVKVDSNKKNQLDNEAKSRFEEETRLTEMSLTLESNRRLDKQKLEDDVVAFTEGKKSDASKALADSQRLEESHKIAEAHLNREASRLKEKYLNEMETIGAALINLESGLVSELERVGRELNELTVHREQERNRIENDGKQMQQRLLADQQRVIEQTKTLQEQLCSAVANLELERIGMDDIDKDPVVEEKRTNWFDFGGSSRKIELEEEKQRKMKLVEFKLKEMELEEDIEDIKEDIHELQEEVVVLTDNLNNLQAEVEQEQRQLELNSCEIQERLKTEIRQIQYFYQTERERLSKLKNDLESTRIENDKWLASEGEKLRDKYDLGQKELVRASNERTQIEHEYEGILNKNAIALSEKRIKEETPLMLERGTLRRNKIECEKVVEGNDKSKESQGKERQLRCYDEQAKTRPNRLPCFQHPESFEENASLNSADIFDSPKTDEHSRKKFLGAALKAKEENAEKELTKTPNVEEGFGTTRTTVEANHCDARSPTRAIAEKRRKAEESRNRALAIRNGTSSVIKSSDGLDTTHSIDSVAEETIESSRVQQNVEIVHTTVENGHSNTKAISRGQGLSLNQTPSSERCTDGNNLGKSAQSEKCQQNMENRTVDSVDFSMNLPSPFPSPSLQHAHPIHPMILEADRLTGFIRRYQNKLEKVCRSLLTLASVRGEPEALTARELDLPKMYSFLVEQDWYKAHLPDKESLDLPHLMFPRVENVKAADSGGNNRYRITAAGKLFLELDGPVKSDVCYFLTFLDNNTVPMTRDAMQGHWKEISRLSGDVQSQRVCNNLDKMISFCFDSRMIQN